MLSRLWVHQGGHYRPTPRREGVVIGTEFFYEDGGRKHRGWYTIDGDLITVRSAYGNEQHS